MHGKSQGEESNLLTFQISQEQIQNKNIES